MRPRFTGQLVVTALVLLAAPCGSAAPEEGGGAPPAVREPTGHERMLALLRQVAEESRGGNPYVGEGPPSFANLGTLPINDVRRAWLFPILTGRDHLRLGRIEAAIVSFQEAHVAAQALRQQLDEEQFVRATFELGLAHMRLAESENCVARHTSESCIFPIREGGVHQVQGPAEKAAEYFTKVLEMTSGSSLYRLRARWLLNIVMMVLGRYPAGVPEPYRIAPQTFASDLPFPRFIDVAPQNGLNATDLAGSTVVDDFDDDGVLDVLVTSAETSTSLRMYARNAEGHFRERTEAAGLTGLFGGLNAVQADFDNDGDTDLLVLRGAWWRDKGRHPKSLLRNNGDRTFTDVTFEAGLAEVHYPSQTATWTDIDLDGDLDLYVGNETQRDIRAPNQLFRNNGNGTFTDIAKAAGVENYRFAKGVTSGDFDGDRYPDLYVSNLGQDNRLYRNNRDGTFTDAAMELGVTLPTASFPTWFWDYDNDGALDLFVSAYGGPGVNPDVAEVAASYLGLPVRSETSGLYRGDGKGGAFKSVGTEAGLTRVTLAMGANFGDLDNDGYLDIYLGTGYPFFEGLMPNVMYLNQGGKRFADVTTNGGFGHLQKGHGIAFADLDNDGDQDVYAQMGGMYRADGFGDALFENPGTPNHWIKVRLVGKRSNRSAIGARIRIDVIEDDLPRSIFRHVGSGASFGANPLRQEIGLGRAKKIERLEVYWPTSDTTQRFDGLAADQFIEIVEGAEGYRKRELPRHPLDH